MTRTSENAATPDPKTDDKTAGRDMTVLEEVWDVSRTVLIAVGVTLFVRFFFFQPFNIPSGSMMPTMLVGDFILVDKVQYGYSRASLIFPVTRLPVDGRLFGDTPERGEIVVFKNANDRNRDYIKRVVGVPGDSVQVKAGVLHINGERVQREQLADVAPMCPGLSGRLASSRARVYRETLPGGPSYVIQECRGDSNSLDNTDLFEVPAGHYFMMGDNRDNSADSRTNTVRFVPHDQIVGRATRIAFSIDGSRARFWEIWKWPFAIRYSRLLSGVE